jgi:hypothetical protein
VATGDQSSFAVHLLTSGAESKLVPCATDWTIAQLVLHAFPESAEKQVRVVFQGRVLDAAATLEQSGVGANSYMHCQFSERKTAEELAAEARGGFGEQDGDDNIDPAQYADADLQFQTFMQARAQRPNRHGTNGQFVVGLMVGGVFGLLSLLWLVQRGVTFKQRLGIGIGIALNLVFSEREGPLLAPDLYSACCALLQRWCTT